MNRAVPILLTCLCLLFPVRPLGAQTVTTIATGIPSNGDVTADAAGNVYVSCENADSVIRKIAPDGTVTTFATAFLNSRGLAFDATGDTLFVAKFNFPGPIRKLDPGGGNTLLAKNLNQPTSVAFGPGGDLYVTAATTVHKIDPAGNVSNVTSDAVLNRPHGLAVDENGMIYVASAHDGNIYRVEETSPTATVTFLAWVDGLQQAWACGFMTYHGGRLYITNGDNKVHCIDTSTGLVTDYAGTGQAGGLDGPADQATFSAPNGIWASPDGTIWVAEWGLQRVRRIDPPAVTGAAALPGTGTGPQLAQNRPNPFTGGTAIAFEIGRPGAVRLQIHDAAGRLVRTLVNGERGAGSHVVRWDGRTQEGTVAAAGIYFYRLRSAEGALTRSLTILR